MSQANTETAGYRFDSFYLDPRNRQLWREDKMLALNSRYFDVLLLLVSRKGNLVEKRQIFEEIWAGVFVSDAALTQCIKDIRKQLGDDASKPRYIKTVPKHGYIFIGEVSESPGLSADSGPEALPPLGMSSGESRAAGVRVAERSDAVAVATRSGATARVATTLTRPYKFLDYYAETDSQLFFGREQEIEAICSQIIAHGSFILHGRSGVGKSSILRAGLTPRLRREGHAVLVVRSFTDPVGQIKAGLANLLGETKQFESSLEDLISRAVAHLEGGLVIFFLDQFEEFFSLLSEDDRGRFVAEVGRLMARERGALRLVFTLREDMLAEMSQLKQAIPEIFHHEYRLKRLSREQAALAITGPARAVGCSFEDDLVARLLDDLSDGEGIDPPQLQIVCDNLYDSRSPGGAISLASYERLGTASRILAGYLERVLGRFNTADLQSVKSILTTMISAEGERLVLKPAELEARVGAQARERLGGLVEELITARVVRRRSLDGQPWLELAHDFLTFEVRRWLSADDITIKKARRVIERAMENHEAHRLMIDADALDLLLPFGDKLSLSGEEASLLMASLLNRARPVPEWLSSLAPQAAALVGEAVSSSDPEVRLSAIEAIRWLPARESEGMLRQLALWDKDLGVRKAASITLAERLGDAAEQTLMREEGAEKASIIRRAISLAMIRDYDRRLVRLTRLPVLVSLMIIGGLMWVRLRRGGADIVSRTVGGTLGGAISGVMGGLMLGAGLSMARQATALEAMQLLLVLISLGFFIGAIGGAGISLGMIAAAHVTYRHSKWWSVVGGAAGGATVGGITKLLGVDIVSALFGRSPEGLTGAIEGACLGVGLSLGAVLVTWRRPGARAWQRVLCSSLGAMCAGILLTAIGGNLFSASLEIVARLFADSQLRLDRLGQMFGEGNFGQTTQIILGAVEGLLFGLGVTLGVEILSKNDSAALNRILSK